MNQETDAGPKRAFVTALRCDTLTPLLDRNELFHSALLVAVDYGVTARELADRLQFDPAMIKEDTIESWITGTPPESTVSREEVMLTIASIIEKQIGD